MTIFDLDADVICEYLGNRICVFYCNEEWAKKVFDILLDYFGNNVCNCSRNVNYPARGECHMWIETKHGDVVKFINAKCNTLGNRCDRAIVEPCVSNDIIEGVIDPFLRHDILVKLRLEK